MIKEESRLTPLLSECFERNSSVFTLALERRGLHNLAQLWNPPHRGTLDSSNSLPPRVDDTLLFPRLSRSAIMHHLPNDMPAPPVVLPTHASKSRSVQSRSQPTNESSPGGFFSQGEKSSSHSKTTSRTNSSSEVRLFRRGRSSKLMLPVALSAVNHHFNLLTHLILTHFF